MPTASDDVRFVRLTEIPPGQVAELLNEPRNARHLPLAGHMDDDAVADWIASKDAQWEAHGFGPWAVLAAGDFAGWGGFQSEDAVADFALVLSPRFWGRGADIARAALDAGFGELGLDRVTIALPATRHADRVVARLGFVPDGEAVHGGVVFRRYLLTRDRWTLTAF